MVTTRAKDPAKGALGLPGGFADLGESQNRPSPGDPEEVGLELIEARYLCSEPNTYPYKGVIYKTVDLAFVCRSRTLHKAKADDDVASLRWVPSRRDRPSAIRL